MASPRIRLSALPIHFMSMALRRAAAMSSSSHKDGWVSISLPLLASSKRARVRVEVEEGIVGGGSEPYLGGEGGGEEVWSSWSEGWSEEDEEW